MKKSISFLILFIALACFCVSAMCDEEYRTLAVGSYGNDVLAVKSRMKELGYFSGSNFNNRYTEDTADRVRTFEAASGLDQTGVMTPALQTLLFSSGAVALGEKKETVLLPDVADSAYRLIDENANGDDVLRLKEKLKSLGYFTAKAETSAYNETLAKAIRACQEALGMEATGIADIALQEAIYGPQNASASVEVPTVTPDGPTKAIELPALNEAGFLADETAAPFIHADRSDGHWYYISQKVFIEIQRLQLTKQKITWFETEIRCTPDFLPQAFLAQGNRLPGHNYLSPLKIADQYNAVFAISDDFYGYRWYNRSKGLKQGIIIRNGEIQAEEPQPAGSKKWPYLEILALFQDGSMQVFESDEHTAQEYLDIGAVSTYAFGPTLLRDGELSEYMLRDEYYSYREPRLAMGMIEPWHYYVLCVEGRMADSRSKGVYLNWLADNMKEHGVQEAINLDGGGTACLMFMGKKINHSANSTRSVGSMSGFGLSEQIMVP